MGDSGEHLAAPKGTDHDHHPPASTHEQVTASIRLLLVAVAAAALLLSACGGEDGGTSAEASGAGTDAASGDSGGDSGGDEPSDVAPAPDLTPEQVCSLITPEDLVAVVGGELDKTESLDRPPQCSVTYANSQAVRDKGGANGTNLLVSVPTSAELDGKTGQAGIAVASQYAFFDSDPEPVDVADGGLSDGKYLYFATGGRVVGVVAGDGMTADQLVEVALLLVEPLTP